MKRLIAIPILLLCAAAAFPAVLKVASDGTQPDTQVSPAIAAAFELELPTIVRPWIPSVQC